MKNKKEEKEIIKQVANALNVSKETKVTYGGVDEIGLDEIFETYPADMNVEEELGQADEIVIFSKKNQK